MIMTIFKYGKTKVCSICVSISTSALSFRCWFECKLFSLATKFGECLGLYHFFGISQEFAFP